jgi:hypothetical protein
MKRRCGGMKKKCAGRKKKNMHESKIVRIGDVLSSSTAGMRV